jgi:hypothetical protein
VDSVAPFDWNPVSVLIYVSNNIRLVCVLIVRADKLHTLPLQHFSKHRTEGRDEANAAGLGTDEDCKLYGSVLKQLDTSAQVRFIRYLITL